MSSETRGWGVNTLRVYLLLAVLEGLAAAFYTLDIPAESAGAWLFGYSRARLLMVAGQLLLVGVLLSALASLWRSESWAKRLTDTLDRLLRRNGVWFLVIGFSIASLYLLWENRIRIEQFSSDPSRSAYLIRLTPTLAWFALLGLQTIVAVGLLGYYPPTGQRLAKDRKIVIGVFVLFTIVLLIWAWMQWTSFGLRPQLVVWGGPPPPLLFVQVLGAWLIAMCFLVVWLSSEALRTRFPRATKFLQGVKGKHWLFAGGIWLAAVLIWLPAPFEHSGAVQEPEPPTYEYYPIFDASIHDLISQNILIGEGFKEGEIVVVRRPLYAFFLAGLHALVGQDYLNVASLQAAVLAIFPALIYLLVSSIHSRGAGVFVSALLIMRELNAYGMTEETGGVVHSKVFMSEFPLGVGIALLLFLALLWLRRPRENQWHLIAIGGLIGLLMLVRSQAIVFIPLLFVLIGWLHFRRRPRDGSRSFRSAWLAGSLLLLAGVALTLSPWVWRNWNLTGEITFQERDEIRLFHWAFQPPEGYHQYEPGGEETETGFLVRTVLGAGQAILARPLDLAQKTVPHFLHNTVVTVMALPTSFDLTDLSVYLSTSPLWQNWEGDLDAEMILPVAINVFFFSVGVVWAWQRKRLLGVTPLLFFFAYSLTTAAVQFSGKRYITPVDWILFVYYGIGIIQATIWGLKLIVPWDLDGFIQKPEGNYEDNWKDRPARLGIFLTSGWLLIALAMPISERVIPQRYPDLSSQDTFAAVRSRQDLTPEISGLLDEFENVALSENTLVLLGRALYPRSYEVYAEQYWKGMLPYKIPPEPYRRIGFLLAGPTETQIFFKNTYPPSFPHASDVLVIGCQRVNFVEALAVVVLGERPQIIFRVSSPSPGCLS